MQHLEQTQTKTVSFTVTAAESGTTFFLDSTGVTSIVATLPSTAAGLRYKFITVGGLPTGGAGNALSPATADAIWGDGTDNKDWINSAATDTIGDTVEIMGDGSAGWYIISQTGTWAEEG